MASQSQSKPSSAAAPPSLRSKTEALDVSLHEIGFEIEEVTPKKVSGHLHVTQSLSRCCMEGYQLS
ncbi:unnamed protein product [Prunus brigantina]